MDSGLARELGALRPLGPEHAESRQCKICGSQSPLFDVVDFNKHCSSEPYAFGVSGIPVEYYRCRSCGFIFTDLIDNWKPDEVARFIYNDDYVKVDPEYVSDRPVRTAIHMAEWLHGCEGSRILDYGSGSGKFADEMKRCGFKSIESYDPFSHPTRPPGLFDIITCFEVIEHSPKPLDTLLEMIGMLSESGAILVGQSMQPANIEEIGGRWWYLGPRNGHVSTFTDKTFFTMAGKVGLIYRRGGGGLYGFARPSLAAPIRIALDRNMPIEGWSPETENQTNADARVDSPLMACARILARGWLGPRQRRVILSVARRLGLAPR